MSLNEFLKQRGFSMNPTPCDENDGYISQAQKEHFTKQLARFPHIRTIAEIGFNGGHSAEHFFNQCKNLQMFAAFDIYSYPCTKHAVEYFYRKFENRFVFIQGDSLVKVPEIHQKFPHLKFDLIYIDGCHDFDWALGDIINGKKIAHENTLLWIDDVISPENQVEAAVNFCETLGFIKVEEWFISDDPVFGPRSWLQAKYL